MTNNQDANITPSSYVENESEPETNVRTESIVEIKQKFSEILANFQKHKEDLIDTKKVGSEAEKKKPPETIHSVPVAAVKEGIAKPEKERAD